MKYINHTASYDTQQETLYKTMNHVINKTVHPLYLHRVSRYLLIHLYHANAQANANACSK